MPTSIINAVTDSITKIQYLYSDPKSTVTKYLSDSLVGPKSLSFYSDLSVLFRAFITIFIAIVG